MASANKEDVTLRNIVLAGGVVTTLVMWVSLSDPVNIPKMLLLSLFSAWILGALITSFGWKSRPLFTLGQMMALFFILGILIAAFMSDERYTAFYGAGMRNNGAISYLALAVVGMAAMSSFDSVGVSKLRTILVRFGAFLSVYGFLQSVHYDPIKWNLLYSPVVGTLGNPDFMSAVLGVCAITTFWSVLIERKTISRITAGLLIALELLVIRRTNSMQGILIVAFGFSALMIAFLWSKRKKMGQLALGIGFVCSFPVLLGLLNKGPFAGRLYRGSIQSRIDYWHAAISMFHAHPIFGVGLDRLGESYWQYAPQIQIVANQGTDNAHNVFLQLLATGGLVVFIPYLAMIGVIFFTAIKAIVSASEKFRFELISLLVIWSSLLLISTISIDTLGVAVWFWISGGALYSLSLIRLKEPDAVAKKGVKVGLQAKRGRENKPSYLAPTVSGALVILVFLLVFPAWRSSLAIQDLQRNRSGLDQRRYVSKAIEISNMWPRNPQTLIATADLALRTGDTVTAKRLAKEAVGKDQRSYNAHLLAAISFEKELDFGGAIPFRAALFRLNSWGVDNMMQLIKDYVAVHDLEKARTVSARVAQVIPNSDVAKEAALLAKG